MPTVPRDAIASPLMAEDSPTDVAGAQDTPTWADIALAPRPEPTPQDRAATLCDLGRFADAGAAAREAVTAAPRDPMAWCVSARAQLGLGRAEAALQAATTAGTLDPHSEEPLHLSSLALEQLGREAEAATVAERATRTAPESWRAHARLARCLARLSDRLPDALRAAERARVLAPDEPGPHLAVGAVALADGRPQDATSAYCAALGVDPQCFEAHSRLASLGDGSPAKRSRRRGLRLLRAAG